MKKITLYMITVLLTACVDNTLDETPKDNLSPFRLILDAEEGGVLAREEEYDLEVKFADNINSLPTEGLTITYEITDVEETWESSLAIDKIVYEVEIDDCTFEREIEFTPTDNLSGTIHLTPDEDLNTIPGSFAIVFALPSNNDGHGEFKFTLTALATNDKNVILGAPVEFEYETLDNDVAGEWDLEFATEEEFETFKEVFGPLSHELSRLAFSEVTGEVEVEFEYDEIKITVELVEQEEVTTCEDGESETETENKVIEIEAEYEAEDGELKLEGSHFIVGDDDEIENELDFEVEALYESSAEDEITFSFHLVIDEDNFAEGEELFKKEEGVNFVLNR